MPIGQFREEWRVRRGLSSLSSSLGGMVVEPTYLLRDEFPSDLPAGSINNTLAAPGPGTRTVADTNSIMSIADGVLVVNGTPAVNERFTLGQNIPLLAGRVFKVSFPSFTSMAGTRPVRVGWSTDGTTAGANTPGFDYSSTTTVVVRDGGTVSYTLTVGAAPHSFAFITRALGGLDVGGWSFALINGEWILVYVHSFSVGAAIPWAKLLLAEAVAVNFTMDGFRVPQSLYIPTPLVYDTFTRANGALGNSETTGPDSQTVGALAWTDQVGTWAISTNAAAASALSGGLAIATVPTGTADVHLRIALTRSAGSVGGVARYQSSTDYLRISHDGTNALCEQVVAGTPSTLRTGVATFSAGGYIYLIVRGTTGWLFYNNVAIGASFTVPSSTFGAYGLYTTDTGNTMDAFEVWSDGGNGEHATLNGF